MPAENGYLMHITERGWDVLQARAAALLRQNMELQQRQSSLERRAAFQKGLMAANRDHMQVCLLHSNRLSLTVSRWCDGVQ